MAFPRSITWIGAPGTFGTLAALGQTSSGTPVGAHPVASWGFGPGEALFYSLLTPDGKVILSTVALTEDVVFPTYDHSEINVYDPAADVFYRNVIPTSTGVISAVKPTYLTGGTDAGGGDMCLTADGRVLYTSTGGWDGWDLTIDGLYPSIGFLAGSNTGWAFDNYAQSKTANQLQATNPTAYATLASAPSAGQPWSTRGIGQVTLLPVSGRIAIAHYFPGLGFNSGCLTVWDGNANLLASYQIPSMNSQDGATAITMAPREIKADPSSTAGDERFMVIYDVFGISGPSPVPNHACQEFRYNSGAQTITPMTCPFIAADDNWLPAACWYGADGTFYASGSPASGGGLTVFQASNMAVWSKHAASGNRGYVAAAPATGSWATNGAYATPVVPDWSLAFPSRQSLAMAAPLSMDPATGSILYVGITGMAGAGIPDTVAIPDPTVSPPANLLPGAPADAPYGFEDAVNLLPAEDALLGTASSVGDWITVSATCTLTWTAAGSCPVTPPVVGGVQSNAIKLTALANGLSQVWTNSPGWAPVAPSGKFGYYAAFLAAVTPATCQVQIRWLNSAGTFLGTSTLFSGTDSTSAWTTVAGQATAPANAAFARLVVTANTTTTGQVHYIAAMGVPDLRTPAGWTGFVTTVTRDNQVTRSGGYSLALTAPFTQSTVSGQSPLIPAVAGREYLAGAWIKAGATTGAAVLVIKWYDSGLNPLGSSLETYTVTDSSSAWKYVYAADLAPAGAAWGQWTGTGAVAHAGDTVYFDDLTFGPQPWVSLPRVDLGVLQLRSDVGSTAIGPGRPSLSGRTLWVPIGHSFSGAEQSSYTSAMLTPPGYAPDTTHSQWLIALDLGALIGPAVAQSWSGSYAPPLSLPAGAVPAPGNLALGVPVAIPAGDWAVAAVTWRQPPGAPPVTIASVADDLHSWWEPLGAPSSTSDATGITRTILWYSPRNRGASLVQASPTGFCLSLAMTVLDVTGMTDWIAVVPPATGRANASTALAMSVPPPGSAAILFATAGSDLLTATISGPGSGWTPITPVTASNGTDHTSDLQLNVAWQVTAGAAAAAWSSTAPVDFSGVLGGLYAVPAGLTQPNPDWPIVIPEAAIGAGRLTPADQMNWVPLAATMLELAHYVQGRSYERAELTTGDGVLTVDNPAGLLLPPAFPQSAGIDSGTPIRIRCYWPGMTGGPPNPAPWNVPASCFVERMPQAWDQCRRGFTEAEVTDLLASLTGALRAVLLAELVADGPYALWPCTDLAGSRIASNLAPGNGNPLFVTTSKYGTGGATQAFGQNGGALPGAAGVFLISPQYQVSSQDGMWGQTLASTTPAAGFCLLGASQSFPPLSAGITVETWFQFQSASGTPFNIQGAMLLLLQRPGGPGFGVGGFLQVYVDNSTGGLNLAAAPFSGSTSIGAAGVDYRSMAAPAHLALALTSTTWVAYINGVRTASGTFSPAQSPVFTMLSLNGTQNYSGSGPGPTSGFIGWLAIFPRVLHPLRILTHYAAGAAGAAGDAASYRIERILGAAGAASLRRLIEYETPFTSGGGGPDAVGSCSDWPGSPAGQALNNVAASTPPGVTCVTPGGELFVLSKELAFGQPAKWVLGENVSGGEIPYLTDFALGYDDQHVANDVTLTQLDSQATITSQVPAVSGASQALYGQQTVNGTGYLQGDPTKPLNFGPGLFDQANWIANTFRKPLTRGEVVTVDAARFPSAWSFVLGASVGDMVLLNRRPLGLAPPGVISIPGRISQTTRNLAFGHNGLVVGSITCIIDAAPEAFVLTADDPILGQLDGRNVLAW